MPRVLSAAERAALSSPDFKIYARLLVDGVAVEDLLDGFNPVLSGQASGSIDQPVQSATFKCRLLTPSGRSLSPYLSTGVTLGGRPLFETGRSVMLQLQTPPAGVPADPGGWRNAFDGVIDDPDAAADNSTAITLACRDQYARLLDYSMENITTTAQGKKWGFPVTGGPAEDVIRQILASPLPGWRRLDEPGNPPFVYEMITVDPGTLQVRDYWQERMSLLEAARRFAIQDGRDLRGLWFGEEFPLVYYRPRPTQGFAVNWAFRPGHFPTQFAYTQIQKLSAPIATVRNVWEVTPFHPTDPSVRVPQIVQDDASIALYGRRFAAVSQDRATGIDSIAKGQALAAEALAQTKDPKFGIQLLTPFYWFVELSDLFALPDGNGINYDVDTRFSVVAWSWQFDRGKGSATITGRSGGAAASREWREVKSTPVYVSTGDPLGPGIEGAFWAKVAPPLTLATPV